MNARLIKAIMLLVITFSTLGTIHMAHSKPSAITTLRSYLAPLIEKSKTNNENGQIFADEFNTAPFSWSYPCNEKTIKRLGIKPTKGEDACLIHNAIRTIVTNAICRDDKKSYETLWHLTSHYHGYIFSQSQSLYLAHHSKALGLNTNFYQRTKTIMKFSLDKSHDPQTTRSVQATLEAKDFPKARTRTPVFNSLCK